MLCHVVPIGLQNAHIFNGTLELTPGTPFIIAVEQLNTIRFTDMRLVVVSEPQSMLVELDDIISVLDLSHHEESLILENCRVEAAFDSPALDQLVGCTVMEGAQVASYALLCSQCIYSAQIQQPSQPAFAAMSTISQPASAASICSDVYHQYVVNCLCCR
jgi:hypothetical protein